LHIFVVATIITFMKSKPRTLEQVMHATWRARQINLGLLLAKEGGATIVARKLGYANSSYIASLARPGSQMPETVARSIEATLGLQKGWLDLVV
jgi:hypothetical protein